MKSEIYTKKKKIEYKISKLKGEKDLLEKNLKKINDKEKESLRKKGEKFLSKIFKIYSKLLNEYDINRHIHYEYNDDADATDRIMLNKITEYDEFTLNTELPYNTEDIIEENIKEAIIFARAMDNHVKMLKEFKKEILKMRTCSEVQE